MRSENPIKTQAILLETKFVALVPMASTTTVDLASLPEDYDMVEQEEYSTSWYATKPIVKYIYRFFMRGCTSRPVFHPLVDTEDEEQKDESENYSTDVS